MESLELCVFSFGLASSGINLPLLRAFYVRDLNPERTGYKMSRVAVRFAVISSMAFNKCRLPHDREQRWHCPSAWLKIDSLVCK